MSDNPFTALFAPREPVFTGSATSTSAEGGPSKTGYTPLYRYRDPNQLDADLSGDRTAALNEAAGRDPRLRGNQVQELNIYGEVLPLGELLKYEGGKELVDIAYRNRKGRRGFIGAWAEGPGTDFIPFVGDLFSIGTSLKSMARVRDSLRKVAEGRESELSTQDKILTRLYVADAERAAGATFFGKVGGVTRMAPAFAAELLLTSGAAGAVSVARAGSKVAAKKTAAKILAGQGDDLIAAATKAAMKKQVAAQAAKSRISAGAVKFSAGAKKAIAKDVAQDILTQLVAAGGDDVAKKTTQGVLNAVTKRAALHVDKYAELVANPRRFRAVVDFVAEYTKRGLFDHNRAIERTLDPGVWNKLREAAGVLFIEAPVKGGLYKSFDFAVDQGFARAMGADEAVTKLELMYSLSPNESTRRNAKMLAFGSAWAEYASEMSGGAFAALGSVVGDAARKTGQFIGAKSGLRAAGAASAKDGGSYLNKIIKKAFGTTDELTAAWAAKKREVAETAIRRGDPAAKGISKLADLLNDRPAMSKLMRDRVDASERTFYGYWFTNMMMERGIGPQEVANAIKQMGYDGILEEFMEERYSGFAQGLFGLDGEDRKGMERLAAGARQFFPDTWEDAAVEIVAFAIPTVLRAVSFQAYTFLDQGMIGNARAVKDGVDNIVRGVYGNVLTESDEGRAIVSVKQQASEEGDQISELREKYKYEPVKNIDIIEPTDSLVSSIMKLGKNQQELYEDAHRIGLGTRVARFAIGALNFAVSGHPHMMFQNPVKAILSDGLQGDGRLLAAGAYNIHRKLTMEAVKRRAESQADSAGTLQSLYRGMSNNERAELEASIEEEYRQRIHELTRSHLAARGVILADSAAVDNYLDRWERLHGPLPGGLTRETALEKFGPEISAAAAGGRITMKPVQGDRVMFQVSQDHPKTVSAIGELVNAYLRDIGAPLYFDADTVVSLDLLTSSLGGTSFPADVVDQALLNDGSRESLRALEWLTTLLYPHRTLSNTAQIEAQYEETRTYFRMVKASQKYLSRGPAEGELRAKDLAEQPAGTSDMIIVPSLRVLSRYASVFTSPSLWTRGYFNETPRAGHDNPMLDLSIHEDDRREALQSLMKLADEFAEKGDATDKYEGGTEAERQAAMDAARNAHRRAYGTDEAPGFETRARAVLSAAKIRQTEHPADMTQLVWDIDASAVNHNGVLYMNTRASVSATGILEDRFEMLFKNFMGLFTMTDSKGTVRYRPAVKEFITAVSAAMEREAARVDADQNADPAVAETLRVLRTTIFDPNTTDASTMVEALSKATVGIIMYHGDLARGGRARVGGVYYSAIGLVSRAVRADSSANAFRSLVNQAMSGNPLPGKTEVSPLSLFAAEVIPAEFLDNADAVSGPGVSDASAIQDIIRSGILVEAEIDNARKGRIGAGAAAKAAAEGLFESQEEADRVIEESQETVRNYIREAEKNGGYLPEDLPALARTYFSAPRTDVPVQGIPSEKLQDAADSVEKTDVDPEDHTPPGASLIEYMLFDNPATAYSIALARVEYNKTHGIVSPGEDPAASLFESVWNYWVTRHPFLAGTGPDGAYRVRNRFLLAAEAHGLLESDLKTRAADTIRAELARAAEDARAFMGARQAKAVANLQREGDLATDSEGNTIEGEMDAVWDDMFGSEEEGEAPKESFAEHKATEFVDTDPAVNLFSALLNYQFPEAENDRSRLVQILTAQSRAMYPKNPDTTESIASLFDGKAWADNGGLHPAFDGTEQDWKDWIMSNRPEYKHDRFAVLRDFLSTRSMDEALLVMWKLKDGFSISLGSLVLQRDQNGTPRTASYNERLHTQTPDAEAHLARSLASHKFDKAAATAAADAYAAAVFTPGESADQSVRNAVSLLAGALDALFGPDNIVSREIRAPGAVEHLVRKARVNKTLRSQLVGSTRARGQGVVITSGYLAKSIQRAVNRVVAGKAPAAVVSEFMRGDIFQYGNQSIPSDHGAGNAFLNHLSELIRMSSAKKESDPGSTQAPAKAKGNRAAPSHSTIQLLNSAAYRTAYGTEGDLYMGQRFAAWADGKPVFFSLTGRNYTTARTSRVDEYGDADFYQSGYDTPERTPRNPYERPDPSRFAEVSAHEFVDACRKMYATHADGYVYLPLYNADKKSPIGVTWPADKLEALVGKADPTFDEALAAVATILQLKDLKEKRVQNRLGTYGPALQFNNSRIVAVIPVDDSMRSPTTGRIYGTATELSNGVGYVIGKGADAARRLGFSETTKFHYHGGVSSLLKGQQYLVGEHNADTLRPGDRGFYDIGASFLDGSIETVHVSDMDSLKESPLSTEVTFEGETMKLSEAIQRGIYDQVKAQVDENLAPGFLIKPAEIDGTKVLAVSWVEPLRGQYAAAPSHPAHSKFAAVAANEARTNLGTSLFDKAGSVFRMEVLRRQGGFEALVQTVLEGASDGTRTLVDNGATFLDPDVWREIGPTMAAKVVGAYKPMQYGQVNLWDSNDFARVREENGEPVFDEDGRMVVIDRYGEASPLSMDAVVFGTDNKARYTRKGVEFKFRPASMPVNTGNPKQRYSMYVVPSAFDASIQNNEDAIVNAVATRIEKLSTITDEQDFLKYYTESIAPMFETTWGTPGMLKDSMRILDFADLVDPTTGVFFMPALRWGPDAVDTGAGRRIVLNGKLEFSGRTPSEPLNRSDFFFFSSAPATVRKAVGDGSRGEAYPVVSAGANGGFEVKYEYYEEGQEMPGLDNILRKTPVIKFVLGSDEDGDKSRDHALFSNPAGMAARVSHEKLKELEAGAVSDEDIKNARTIEGALSNGAFFAKFTQYMARPVTRLKAAPKDLKGDYHLLYTMNTFPVKATPFSAAYTEWLNTNYPISKVDILASTSAEHRDASLDADIARGLAVSTAAGIVNKYNLGLRILDPVNNGDPILKKPSNLKVDESDPIAKAGFDYWDKKGFRIPADAPMTDARAHTMFTAVGGINNSTFDNLNEQLAARAGFTTQFVSLYYTLLEGSGVETQSEYEAFHTAFMQWMGAGAGEAVNKHRKWVRYRGSVNDSALRTRAVDNFYTDIKRKAAEDARAAEEAEANNEVYQGDFLARRIDAMRHVPGRFSNRDFIDAVAFVLEGKPLEAKLNAVRPFVEVFERVAILSSLDKVITHGKTGLTFPHQVTSFNSHIARVQEMLTEGTANGIPVVFDKPITHLETLLQTAEQQAQTAEDLHSHSPVGSPLGQALSGLKAPKDITSHVWTGKIIDSALPARAVLNMMPADVREKMQTWAGYGAAVKKTNPTAYVAAAVETMAGRLFQAHNEAVKTAGAEPNMAIRGLVTPHDRTESGQRSNKVRRVRRQSSGESSVNPAEFAAELERMRDEGLGIPEGKKPGMWSGEPGKSEKMEITPRDFYWMLMWYSAITAPKTIVSNRALASMLPLFGQDVLTIVSNFQVAALHDVSELESTVAWAEKLQAEPLYPGLNSHAKFRSEANKKGEELPGVLADLDGPSDGADAPLIYRDLSTAEARAALAARAQKLAVAAGDPAPVTAKAPASPGSHTVKIETPKITNEAAPAAVLDISNPEVSKEEVSVSVPPAKQETRESASVVSVRSLLAGSAKAGQTLAVAIGAEWSEYSRRFRSGQNGRAAEAAADELNKFAHLPWMPEGAASLVHAAARLIRGVGVADPALVQSGMYAALNYSRANGHADAVEQLNVLLGPYISRKTARMNGLEKQQGIDLLFGGDFSDAQIVMAHAVALTQAVNIPSSPTAQTRTSILANRLLDKIRPAERRQAAEAPAQQAAQAPAGTAVADTLVRRVAPSAFAAKELAKNKGATAVLAPVADNISDRSFAKQIGLAARAQGNLLPNRPAVAGDVVYVSVPGRRRGATEAQINQVGAEAVAAVAAGAVVRTDTKAHAERDWNKGGEGVVRAILVKAGLTESVVKDSQGVGLYSEWSKPAAKQEAPAETEAQAPAVNQTFSAHGRNGAPVRVYHDAVVGWMAEQGAMNVPITDKAAAAYYANRITETQAPATPAAAEATSPDVPFDLPASTLTGGPTPSAVREFMDSRPPLTRESLRKKYAEMSREEILEDMADRVQALLNYPGLVMEEEALYGRWWAELQEARGNYITKTPPRTEPTQTPGPSASLVEGGDPIAREIVAMIEAAKLDMHADTTTELTYPDPEELDKLRYSGKVRKRTRREKAEIQRTRQAVATMARSYVAGDPQEAWRNASSQIRGAIEEVKSMDHALSERVSVTLSRLLDPDTGAIWRTRDLPRGEISDVYSDANNAYKGAVHAVNEALEDARDSLVASDETNRQAAADMVSQLEKLRATLFTNYLMGRSMMQALRDVEVSSVADGAHLESQGVGFEPSDALQEQFPPPGEHVKAAELSFIDPNTGGVHPADSFKAHLLDTDTFLMGSVMPILSGNSDIRSILLDKSDMAPVTQAIQKANFFTHHFATGSDTGYIPVAETVDAASIGPGDDKVFVMKRGRDGKVTRYKRETVISQVGQSVTGAKFTAEEFSLTRFFTTAVTWFLGDGGADARMQTSSVAHFAGLPWRQMIASMERRAGMRLEDGSVVSVREYLSSAFGKDLRATVSVSSEGLTRTRALHHALVNLDNNLPPQIAVRMEKKITDAVLKVVSNAVRQRRNDKAAPLDYNSLENQVYDILEEQRLIEYRTTQDKTTGAVSRYDYIFTVPVTMVEKVWAESSAAGKLEAAGRSRDSFTLRSAAEMIRPAFQIIEASARSRPWMMYGAGRLFQKSGGVAPWYVGSGVWEYYAKRSGEAVLPELDAELSNSYESLKKTFGSSFYLQEDGTRVAYDAEAALTRAPQLIPMFIDILGGALPAELRTSDGFVAGIKRGVFEHGKYGVNLTRSASMWDLAKELYKQTAVALHTSALSGGKTSDAEAAGVNFAVYMQAVDAVRDELENTGTTRGMTFSQIYDLTGALPLNMTADELLTHHAQEMATAMRFRSAVNQMLFVSDEHGMPRVYMRPGDAPRDDTIPDAVWGMAARWWMETAKNKSGGILAKDAHYNEGETGKANARRIFDALSGSLKNDDLFKSMTVPREITAVSAVYAQKDPAGDDTKASLNFFSGGEAAGYVQQMFDIPSYRRLSGALAGINRVLSWSKSTSVMMSYFFPIATTLESPTGANGLLPTILGLTSPGTKLAKALSSGDGWFADAMKKAGLDPDVPYMSDVMRMIGSNDPALVDLVVQGTLAGITLPTKSKNIVDNDRSVIARDINKRVADVRAVAGEKAARGTRILLEGALEHGMEMSFEYLIYATKLATFAQMSNKLKQKAMAAGRWWDPVNDMRPWAHYINSEIGGIDPAMYPYMTRQLQRFSNGFWFSWQWTQGAWTAGGGDILTAKLFGATSTPQARRHTFSRWLRMYFGIMVGVPQFLQFLVTGLAKATGNGDDDDQWFTYMNEKGHSWHDFDITPLLRTIAAAPALPTAAVAAGLLAAPAGGLVAALAAGSLAAAGTAAAGYGRKTVGDVKRALPGSVGAGPLSIPVGILIPALTGQEGDRPTSRKRRYYMHFGKQGWEDISWFKNPFRAMMSKTSMPLQRLYEGLFGTGISTGWDMPFKDKGFWERWVSLDGDNSAFINLANSMVPFTVAGTRRSPEVGALAMFGPTGKGMSKTMAEREMAKMFKEWGNSESYIAKHKGVPGSYSDLTAKAVEWLHALRLNGYDPNKSLVSAISVARREQYDRIHKALPAWEHGSGNERELEAAARGLYRLNYIHSSLLDSIKGKDTAQNIDRTGVLGKKTSELIRRAFENPYGTGEARRDNPE